MLHKMDQEFNHPLTYFYKTNLGPCLNLPELSNQSSGVQIPRDICTRFVRFRRYLYSTKCNWIIKTVTRYTLAGVTRDNMKMRVHYKARALKHRPNQSLISYQYKSLLGLRLQKKSSLFSPRGLMD